MCSQFFTWIIGWTMTSFNELENTCSKAYDQDMMGFEFYFEYVKQVSWEYLNEDIWESLQYIPRVQRKSLAQKFRLLHHHHENDNCPHSIGCERPTRECKNDRSWLRKELQNHSLFKALTLEAELPRGVKVDRKIWENPTILVTWNQKTNKQKQWFS